jgi:hypothetical protein
MKKFKKKLAIFYHIDYSSESTFVRPSIFIEITRDIINSYEPILIPNNACFMYSDKGIFYTWTYFYENSILP